MLKSYTKELVDRLTDGDYAKQYGAEMAKLELATTLMRVRTEARLTQAELSERLGVSQPYIAKLESGEANPTIAFIGKILATIGLRLITGAESLLPEDGITSTPSFRSILETPTKYWNSAAGTPIFTSIGSMEASAVAFEPSFGTVRDLLKVGGIE